MFEINQFSLLGIDRLGELYLSILMTIAILLYFMFPLNKFLLNKLTNSENFTNSDAFSINIVLHSFFFLIFSFYQINKEYLAIFVIFFSLILNIYFLKKNIPKKEMLILFIFVTFLSTYCLNLSSFAAMDWDGTSSWFYKTQIFFQGGTLSDIQKVPFSFYPHLGTYVWAFFWKISQSDYEFVGRFFYVIIFLISTLSISSRVNNYEYKIIFYISAVLFLTETTLFGGYQEYFVFSLIGIFSSFFFFLEDDFKKNKIKFSILFLLIINILPWIKDEAVVGSALLLLSIMLTKKYQNKEKILIFAICTLGLIVSYLIENNIKNGVDFQFNLDFSKLYYGIKNFPSIFIGLFFETLKVFIRYPVWIAIIFCGTILILDKNLNNKNEIKTICLIFFIQFFIFFIGYFFLNKDIDSLDAIWHFQTSTFRLLLQMSSFYIILIAKYVNQYEEKF